MKFKSIILLCIIQFITAFTKVAAHDSHNHSHQLLKIWNILSTDKPVEASFLMFKDGEVFLEKKDHSIANYPLEIFSQEDQAFIKNKILLIQSLNSGTTSAPLKSRMALPNIPWVNVFALFSIFLLIVYYTGKKRFGRVIALFSFLIVLSFYNFSPHSATLFMGTDPLEMDKAFAPFKPEINTFWDADYFHVESKGIPNHLMMKGITGWQQQVPIPQCYIGSNSWSIPLNPVIAATPVPVNPQHFLRGAIAVAVNGVPIFNPYTNTGVDAFLDGQLDIYGGHCGRADDYHYHTAPLQLHSLGQTAVTNPLAFALDGFAIYGSLEPDGSVMKTLDVNHGHFGNDGVYHYHGTAAAPYMIGNMVGKVTEDNTMQIIPQAAAKDVRPALTPLQGAVITICTPNASKNGYTLEYTKSGQKYSVEYSWTTTGKYTFNFINPTGTTMQTYNGFVQCEVPLSATNDLKTENQISIYPNPSNNILTIKINENWNTNDIRNISILDINGKILYQNSKYEESIDISHFPKGIKFVHVNFNGGDFSKKIINQ